MCIRDRIKKSNYGSEEFGYNLSAFLSAFRSITFTLQATYKHSPDYVKEYEELRAKLAANSMARDLVTARNTILKEGHKSPFLIIRIKDKASGDIVEYESGPIMGGLKSFWSIRILPTPRDETSVSADTPQDQLGAKSLAIGFAIMAKVICCASKEAECRIRLVADGAEISLKELYSKLGDLLDLLEGAVNKFEKMWPQPYPDRKRS